MPNGQIAVSRHSPVDLNDGPAALLYRNLMTRTSPDDRAALTASGQAPISNPHSYAARAAPTCYAGPRFPPPRLLGRLPPELAASFFSGRRPRSLNVSRPSARVDLAAEFDP